MSHVWLSKDFGRTATTSSPLHSPDEEFQISVWFEMANAEGRVLITEDRDFGELVVRQRLGIAGVMLLELDRLTNSGEADRVGTVVSAHADKLVGNLVVVDPARLRLRPLE